MKDGQIYLAAGRDESNIKKMLEKKWLTEENIEGVGTVYTLTKEGFKGLEDAFWADGYAKRLPEALRNELMGKLDDFDKKN